ncbi:MAG: CHAT domain-containing protein [Gammaproteobacteria bacterium]|nr:CHAT domain-containing protein [Gammaproteobacteria bacterium]
MQETILIFAANPLDTEPLDLGEELRAIERALVQSQRRDAFDLRCCHAPRPQDLQEQLLRCRPGIVHFCGHGEGENGICLQNENSEIKLADSTALADLFQLCVRRFPIRCVLLNACYSEHQAAAIRAHVPCVIGMRAAIANKAAQAFSTGFYQAIGRGDEIESAFAMGRNAIQLELHGKDQQARMPVLVAASHPIDRERDFLREVLTTFQRKPALALLAQEDRMPLLDELEQGLQQRFGAGNVYHLSPSAGRRGDRYFNHLGKRLGFDNINDDADLEDALWDKLENDGSLCLLISRLEKGNPGHLRDFAGILRNLLEESGFHVLLCGGRELAELCFEDGSMSLLNSAHPMEWPEYGVSDLQQLYSQSGNELDPQTAAAMLARGGGHPALMQICFEKYQAGQKEAEWLPHLIREPGIVAMFTRLKKDPQAIRQVREWLQQEDLGAAQVYIQEPLLRRLYWQNLLTRRADRLVWRCAAIREIGWTVMVNC